MSNIHSIQQEAELHHSNWQQPSEGVVIACHTDSHTDYAAAGRIGIDGPLPTKSTIFEIGSISKVFTSILLAEAVREKRADFADPVSTHLAELPLKKHSPLHTITLTELATHTSGLPRLPMDLTQGLDKENPYRHYDEQRLQQSLLLLRKKHLEGVGEYCYSNYGVGILGYVIAQAYGVSFRDLLKEKILDPLAMTSTDVPLRFADLPEAILNRLATPHFAGTAVKHWELSSLAGAGGMISSAEDLIRFGRAHWDEKTPLGLAASLAEVAKLRMKNQGLGWALDGEVLNHDGGTGGFRTSLEVSPGDKKIRVFLANSAGVSDEPSVEGDFLSVAGYWSGDLVEGDEKLRFVSYIAPTGRMLAYSIDQNYRAIVSANSRLHNNRFHFSFPSSSAIYEGEVVNQELHGTLTQGIRKSVVQTVQMKYSRQMPDILHNGLKKTMRGDLAGLHGYWWGYLGGQKGLLVYIKVVGIGELTVLEFYSPDQMNEAIEVHSASLVSRKFKFHSDLVGGTYIGWLAKDGQCIRGFWRQVMPMPLKLYFSEEKPSRD